MTNKLSSLQLYLRNAGQLARAGTFLAAAKRVESLKPLAQRRLARLKDRPYPYREWLQTLAAFLEPVALDPFWVLLALLGASSLEDMDFLPASAVRAYRAIRPDEARGGFESRRFILEMGLIQDKH
jgi:hypothetical protein